MYCNRYRAVVLASTFILSLSLLTPVWTYPKDFQSYARCPNGSHKSPSGDCESVTRDTLTDTSSSSSNSINNNPSVFNSPTQQSIDPQNNIVVASNTISSSNTALFSSMPATPVNNASISNPLTSGKCDQSLWSHVYHPERLQIIDSFKSVLIKIESKKSEPDGDFHIRVRLDPQFSNS